MAEPAFQSRAAAWAARIILALASLSVALLVAEIGLRWILPPAQVPLGPHPGFLTHDATLGWVPVPGGNGTMGGEEFSVAVSINDQGFRGPRTYPRARLPGIPRVVVVGDSFSFGYGVRHEENWITRIEHALAPAEVINLAVTGYGTDQQLLRLEAIGLEWQPDLVVVALFEGNVFRNARRQQVGYPKPRFVLDRNDELTLTGVPVEEVAPKPGFIARSALGRLVLGRGGELFEHLGFGEAWPVTEAILGRMKAVTARNGIDLVTVVIPKDQAVHGTGMRRTLHERTLGTIGDMLDALGIEHLDLTPQLAAIGADERLYFWTDGHWNARGHAVAAEAAARFLQPHIEIANP